MALLEVKKVNKYYPIGDNSEFHALKDVNLSFDKGELVTVIGESGSGKSTLMNILGGLDSQFSGEVVVDGENIGDYNEKEMVKYHKEKVGFVFQSFNLISHLSILDNVTLAMTLSNVDRASRVKRAKEVLEQLGLKDHYAKKPNQLSGGQKQRVAIARALVNDPDIIIADEPTGALDSETSDQVLNIIQQIAESGKLVILVSHSTVVADRSSRVVTIADGVIIDDQNSGKLPEIEGDFTMPEFERTETNKNLSIFSAIRMAMLNMKEKIGRNILIALGGSIGIMSIILMLALGQGVNDYLTDTMNENVNPLIIQATMTKDTESESAKEAREEKEGTPEPGNRDAGFSPLKAASDDAAEGGISGPPGTQNEIVFEPENIEELREIAHVEDVTEGFSAFSFTKNAVEYGDDNYTYMSFGTISPDMTPANILYGEMPNEKEVLITEGLALSIMDVGEEIIGEELIVKVDVEGEILKGSYSVSGIYQAGDTIGPAGAFDSVYMNLSDFALLNQEAGQEIQPNVVYITSESEDLTQDIKAEVKELGYGGSSADIMIEIFSQLLDVFTYIMIGVAGVSLVVSAIMILTVLYISVVERTQEIGVIKAIGGRKKDIRRIFVSESFLIGLFSGLLGAGIATGISLIGNVFAKNALGTTILHMTPVFVLSGVLVSIVISVLAGLFPANKAAGLDPVEALRRD